MSGDPRVPASVARRLGKARHAEGLKVTQRLTDDAGTLAIIFDDFQVGTEERGIGVAQRGAEFAIPVDGDPGVARIIVEATLQFQTIGGTGEFWLSTPFGEKRHQLHVEETVVVRATADVVVPTVYRFALGCLIWAIPSGSFALLSVDSVGVVLDPDAVPDTSN